MQIKGFTPWQKKTAQMSLRTTSLHARIWKTTLPAPTPRSQPGSAPRPPATSWSWRWKPKSQTKTQTLDKPLR